MNRNRTGSYPRHYWTGLTLLLLAYTALQFVYYLPASSLPKIIKKSGLSPLWFLLVVVYVAGSVILRQTRVAWLNAIWHLVHISLITFALAVLVYGRLAGSVPIGVSAAVRPILEFLISPILYLAMGLLYKSMRMKDNS
jgi:hypothetical protein